MAEYRKRGSDKREPCTNFEKASVNRNGVKCAIHKKHNANDDEPHNQNILACGSERLYSQAYSRGSV
jgi:hypothetical protein